MHTILDMFSGGQFYANMSSYQYRGFDHKDMMVMRLSYLYVKKVKSGKTTSLGFALL